MILSVEPGGAVADDLPVAEVHFSFALQDTVFFLNALDAFFLLGAEPPTAVPHQLRFHRDLALPENRVVVK